MRTDDFDYDLPPELIAQVPPERRDGARMLVLGRRDGSVAHRAVTDFPDHLRAGDLLVVNDTRVVAARLFARRSTGGRIEVFVLGPENGESAAWRALLKSGGAPREGEEVTLEGEGGPLLLAARHGGGEWTVALPVADPAERARRAARLFDAAGHVPLPPYIRRERDDPREAMDRERYQTVYAAKPGAVAAPTAGLHLTEEMLTRIAARGVERATVTLHVGLGTFRPIESDDLAGHAMHEERYEVPAATAEAIRRTRAAGGRVVAVGTTTVRTLESAADEDGAVLAGEGATSLFITPGRPFRAVDALLTNFHMPRSTLVVLVSAFAGREPLLAAYREAVERRYRFFSYGDAMFIA